MYYGKEKKEMGAGGKWANVTLFYRAVGVVVRACICVNWLLIRNFGCSRPYVPINANLAI